ncbi:MAG: hypothetical protein K8R21_11815, partial [Leptospira sp.]|nr:hypothetical protein [Leptospira sp.]
ESAKNKEALPEENKTAEEVYPPGAAKSITVKLLADGKSVQIDWEIPDLEGKIILARSETVIDTFEKLRAADSLGKYPSTKKESITSYTDSNLRSGKYYYAVVLASEVNKELVKLLPDKNFTTKPVVVNRPVTNNDNFDKQSQKARKDGNYYVTNIITRKEGNAIRILWTAPEGAENDFLYTIYRSKEPLSSIPLVQKAEKLTEFHHPDTSFLDQDLKESATLFYGVSVTVNEKEKIPLIEKKSFKRVFFIYDKENQAVSEEPAKKKKSSKNNRNLSADASGSAPDDDEDDDEKPVKKEEPKKEELKPVENKYSDLDQILIDTYNKKRFREAVFRLKLFSEKENDRFTKGRAYLYIGISYYKQRRFQEGLRYLLMEDSKFYNSDRSEFWAKRCLENIGAGIK